MLHEKRNKEEDIRKRGKWKKEDKRGRYLKLTRPLILDQITDSLDYLRIETKQLWWSEVATRKDVGQDVHIKINVLQ